MALLLACTGCAGAPTPPNNAAEANIVEPVTNEAAPANLAAAAEAQPVNDAEPAQIPEAAGLPADVQRFIEQRQGCEHWAGEPGWDKARQKQIDEAVKELCTGTDAALAALRKRHAGDAQVIAALKDYEAMGM